MRNRGAPKEPKPARPYVPQTGADARRKLRASEDWSPGVLIAMGMFFMACILVVLFLAFPPSTHSHSKRRVRHAQAHSAALDEQSAQMTPDDMHAMAHAAWREAGDQRASREAGTPLHSPDTQVRVVVVEEHHEVLREWVNAARRGEIQCGRTVDGHEGEAPGCTLVHVDSHADLSVPQGYYFFDALPLIPRQWEEALGPADFIVPSMHAGLVRDYHWIRSTFPDCVYNWPTWGAFTFEMGNDHRAPDLDLCIVEMNAVSESPLEGLRPRAESSKWREEPWSWENCRETPYNKKRFNVTTLDVDAARQLPPLCPEDCGADGRACDRCILDIDLDYFSSWDPCQSRLAMANYTSEQQKRLSELLLAFDTNGLTDECWERCVEEDYCEDSLELAHQIFARTAMFASQGRDMQFHTSLREARYLRRFFCKEGFKLRDSLQQLYDFFKQMSVWQAEAFVNVAPACLFNFTYDIGSPHYEPTYSEIHRAARQLMSLLANGSVRPKLITISRSVSSGYTPPHLWPRIEWTVLSLLHETLGVDMVLEYRPGVKPAARPLDCHLDAPGCYHVRPLSWEDEQQEKKDKQEQASTEESSQS